MSAWHVRVDRQVRLRHSGDSFKYRATACGLSAEGKLAVCWQYPQLPVTCKRCLRALERRATVFARQLAGAA